MRGQAAFHCVMQVGCAGSECWSTHLHIIRPFVWNRGDETACAHVCPTTASGLHGACYYGCRCVTRAKHEKSHVSWRSWSRSGVGDCFETQRDFLSANLMHAWKIANLTTVALLLKSERIAVQNNGNAPFSIWSILQHSLVRNHHVPSLWNYFQNRPAGNSCSRWGHPSSCDLKPVAHP